MSADSSRQVSRRPPYMSVSWLKVAHAMADRGNQKKNFSGRSRAWMASANSSAISVSERTTSTFIKNHYHYGRLQPHHLHARVHEQNIAGGRRVPGGWPGTPAASATSAGSVLRRSGARLSTASRTAEKSLMARAETVLTGPAEIAFTRMFRAPSSLARYRMAASSESFRHAHDVVTGKHARRAHVGQRA